jgi:iron complex outermembrane receptor protein
MRYLSVTESVQLVFLGFTFVFLVIAVSPRLLWAASLSTRDLIGLDIEQLMDMEVTSAAKKPQKFSEAAAAIFVITAEDLRRSGATSIPEALRMVPGVEVARIDANKWAISARGFNERFADKLLVLLDGRTLYDPLFSGVYWDVQDTLLEDIDRIEVIRGPGGALWGANAVNGVINIVTKAAKNTQGTLLTAGAGSEERGFGGMRYGGKFGERTYYRVYAKYFDRDEAVTASGDDAADDWRQWRTGFRLDREERQSLFTLQGDLYYGKAGQTLTSATLSPPFTQTFDNDVQVAGGNILGRWRHVLSPSSGWTAQFYYDRAEREDDRPDGEVFRRDHDILDFDFQHRFALGERQEVVWGLGYRFTRDDIGSVSTIAYNPDRREDHLFSVFFQDELSLLPNRLYLILGSKFEHNDFTGLEIQPSLRLRWTPNPRHTLWAAVSRAVHTPSRTNDDVRINVAVFPRAGGLTQLAIVGDRDVDSEELWAFEAGYRSSLTANLSLDAAIFYNDYDRLISTTPGTPFFETDPAPAHLVIPSTFSNDMTGETYGAEIAVTWKPATWWTWTMAYSYLQLQLHGPTPGINDQAEEIEGNSPHHQVKLRSLIDLPHHMEFDTALYIVDNLPGQDIPGYLRLDARLGWHPISAVEISLALQNLLDDRHPEFGDVSGLSATEVEHSLYGKVTWRF